MQEITSLITALNEGWTTGNLEMVSAVLHDDVVFLAPDLKTEIAGKEQCLASLAEYSEHATTHEFTVEETHIRRWEETALARIQYTIEYEVEKERYREKGLELWTLTLSNGVWKLVWRSLISTEPVT